MHIDVLMNLTSAPSSKEFAVLVEDALQHWFVGGYQQHSRDKRLQSHVCFFLFGKKKEIKMISNIPFT